MAENKICIYCGWIIQEKFVVCEFYEQGKPTGKVICKYCRDQNRTDYGNNQDSPIIAPPTIMPKPLLLENKPIMPLTVVKPILAPDKKLAFIKSLRIAVAEGFEPLIPFTQCYHETANFRRLVGEWNYAGMKIPRKAVPPVLIKPIEVWTHEVINGVSRLVKDTFADFNSADDFMLFYIWQIKRLYPVSYENRNNSQQFFRWLTHGVNKWATDNSYSAKLEKLYGDLRANGVYAQMLEVLKNLL